MRTFPLLRRTALLACLALLGGGSAETLTLVSWGGSYEQVSRKAILEPFSKETGIDIRVEVYNGGLAQVRAQVETGKVYWDVVDLEMPDAARGCDEGLLEYVDVSELAPAPNGMSRAFRKLDTIKDSVVWWEAGAQPPQMLADREVVMSTAYNGRIFNAQVIEKQPLVVVWDAQVLDSGMMAIVAKTPNLAAARELVRYATRSEVQAEVGRYISYSPARHSGTKLISTHLETGVDMKPHMPTSPHNMTRVLYNDGEWWSDNADDVNERFSAWLAR